MARRRAISLKTKLASALLALGHIPYDDAVLMSEDQFISLYHFDHAKLHAIDPDDRFFNLTPMLIAEHRIKSRKDTSIVAKTKRIESKWKAFTATMATPRAKRKKPKSRWPSRKIQNRGWRR